LNLYSLVCEQVGGFYVLLLWFQTTGVRRQSGERQLEPEG
jgi:hypothetical protein